MRKTSSKDGFFSWIRERHRIWQRRSAGQPKPWTKDEIMRRYKFTNVFRELDTGTRALRSMTRRGMPQADTIFNVAWYRMFNRAEHAENIGWCETHDQLVDRMCDVERSGAKVFTGCHMHNGTMRDNLRSLGDIANDRVELESKMRAEERLEHAFNLLLKYRCVGPFIAYEIVTDLRFELNIPWRDPMTWANVGPGSKRGLQRLGMKPNNGSMMELLDLAPQYLPLDRWHSQSGLPFEMREIEHSLCEFDKYERARLGDGVPKQRYDGA